MVAAIWARGDSQRNPKTRTDRAAGATQSVPAMDRAPPGHAPGGGDAVCYCSSDRTIWLICDDWRSIEVLACIRMFFEVMFAVSDA